MHASSQLPGRGLPDSPAPACYQKSDYDDMIFEAVF